MNRANLARISYGSSWRLPALADLLENQYSSAAVPKLEEKFSVLEEAHPLVL